MIHPEGPRTLWAHVRDDAPLPVALRRPLRERAHPTLTALRLRLGPHLDGSGLKAEYIALRGGRAGIDDRRTAVDLMERLHRTMRSDRAVIVRVGPDGDIAIEAPAGWTLRRDAATWMWLRLWNGAPRAMVVDIAVCGHHRTVRLPAGGSRSWLERIPGAVGEFVVVAAAGARSAESRIALDWRPSRPLVIRLLDGPARVYLEDDLGPIVPPDMAGRRDTHGRWYVHLRRGLTVPVAGTARIDVARGPEFEPFRATLTAEEVGRGPVRVRLRRVFDPGAGWLSADLHAHLHYGGEYLLDASSARLAQEAEGLFFLNLAVANQESDIVHDRAAFSSVPIGDPRTTTSWGEEFRNDFYGHICLTAPRHLVEPVFSGFLFTEQPFDFPTTVHAARGGEATGALVSSAHPVIASRSMPELFRSARSVEARELPVLAALGLVDSVDVLSFPGDARRTAALWYRLLDCGFRLAASAGSDAFMNVADGEAFMTGERGVPAGAGACFSAPVGGVRLYARSEHRTRDGLCAAIRAGRTYVTNAPCVSLAVTGHEPGDVIDIRARTTLSVEATVVSSVPLDALELVVNGRVRRRLPLGQAPIQASASWTLSTAGPAWIAVRAVGGAHPSVMDDYAFAHTSPVYVDVAGRRVRRPTSLRYFERWIDRLIAALERECRFADPSQAHEVRAIYDRARAVFSTPTAASMVKPR